MASKVHKMADAFSRKKEKSKIGASSKIDDTQNSSNSKIRTSRAIKVYENIPKNYTKEELLKALDKVVKSRKSFKALAKKYNIPERALSWHVQKKKEWLAKNNILSASQTDEANVAEAMVCPVYEIPYLGQRDYSEEALKKALEEVTLDTITNYRVSDVAREHKIPCRTLSEHLRKKEKLSSSAASSCSENLEVNVGEEEASQICKRPRSEDKKIGPGYNEEDMKKAVKKAMQAEINIKLIAEEHNVPYNALRNRVGKAKRPGSGSGELEVNVGEEKVCPFYKLPRAFIKRQRYYSKENLESALKQVFGNSKKSVSEIARENNVPISTLLWYAKIKKGQKSTQSFSGLEILKSVVYIKEECPGSDDPEKEISLTKIKEDLHIKKEKELLDSPKEFEDNVDKKEVCPINKKLSSIIRRRGSYNERDMLKAVKKVLKHPEISVKTIAEEHNLRYKTLHWRVGKERKRLGSKTSNPGCSSVDKNEYPYFAINYNFYNKPRNYSKKDLKMASDEVFKNPDRGINKIASEKNIPEPTLRFHVKRKKLWLASQKSTPSPPKDKVIDKKMTPIYYRGRKIRSGRYTEKTLSKAVKEVRQGGKCHGIAKKYHIPSTTLYRWAFLKNKSGIPRGRMKEKFSVTSTESIPETDNSESNVGEGEVCATGETLVSVASSSTGSGQFKDNVGEKKMCTSKQRRRYSEKKVLKAVKEVQLRGKSVYKIPESDKLEGNVGEKSVCAIEKTEETLVSEASTSNSSRSSYSKDNVGEKKMCTSFGRRRRRYKEKTLIKAVKEVHQGRQSASRIAKKYKIPPATLYLYANKKNMSTLSKNGQNSELLAGTESLPASLDSDYLEDSVGEEKVCAIRNTGETLASKASTGSEHSKDKVDEKKMCPIYSRRRSFGKRQRSYTEQKLIEALKEICEGGKSVNKISRIYKIPVSTLSRYALNKKIMEIARREKMPKSGITSQPTSFEPNNSEGNVGEEKECAIEKTGEVMACTPESEETKDYESDKRVCPLYSVPRRFLKTNRNYAEQDLIKAVQETLENRGKGVVSISKKYSIPISTLTSYTFKQNTKKMAMRWKNPKQKDRKKKNFLASAESKLACSSSGNSEGNVGEENLNKTEMSVSKASTSSSSKSKKAKNNESDKKVCPIYSTPSSSKASISSSSESEKTKNNESDEKVCPIYSTSSVFRKRKWKYTEQNFIKAVKEMNEGTGKNIGQIAKEYKIPYNTLRNYFLRNIKSDGKMRILDKPVAKEEIDEFVS